MRIRLFDYNCVFMYFAESTVTSTPIAIASESTGTTPTASTVTTATTTPFTTPTASTVSTVTTTPTTATTGSFGIVYAH